MPTCDPHCFHVTWELKERCSSSPGGSGGHPWSRRSRSTWRCIRSVHGTRRLLGPAWVFYSRLPSPSTSSQGSRFLKVVLTVVDRFSKMVRFIALPKLPSTKEAAEEVIMTSLFKFMDFLTGVLEGVLPAHLSQSHPDRTPLGWCLVSQNKHKHLVWVGSGHYSSHARVPCCCRIWAARGIVSRSQGYQPAVAIAGDVTAFKRGLLGPNPVTPWTSRQLLRRSNLGFSILLKDISACSSVPSRGGRDLNRRPFGH